MRDPSTCLPISAFPTCRPIVGPTLKAHPGLYFTCLLSQTHCESCYKMPKHRGERTMEKTLYRTWRPRTLQHRSLWLHLLPAWHLKWGFAETKWFYLPCLLQAPGIFWVPRQQYPSDVPEGQQGCWAQSLSTETSLDPHFTLHCQCCLLRLLQPSLRLLILTVLQSDSILPTNAC